MAAVGAPSAPGRDPRVGRIVRLEGLAGAVCGLETEPDAAPRPRRPVRGSAAAAADEGVVGYGPVAAAA